MNPSLALILATFFWGASFTWAKSAGELLNQSAGLPSGSPFGPIFLLGPRFILAAILWLIVFPESRKGWSLKSILRGSILGLLLATSLVVQHLGLDRTSEAVSAFLTSLTVLFVPLLLTLIFRRAPRPILWLGVAVATVGVWLMTGASPNGFGLGEILGLSCALSFSVYILAINALLKHDNPWRMSFAQFFVTGFVTTLCGIILSPGTPTQTFSLLLTPTVPLNSALLTIFASFIAYGILTAYQPKIDPTRAAMLYLFEPIFASLYAWAIANKPLTSLELLGAALILLANLLVELLPSKSPRT